MNEELKIIIKAVTDDINQKLDDVKSKLNEVEKEGKEAGKQIDNAMSGIKKGVGVAIAAVAALSVAMVNLGNKALEASKGLAKLNTAFQSAGGSAAQANDAYRELYGIFGDNDKAVETAQSLSRITTESDKLADYYNILAGAAAKYGDGLQPEALSEQISETIASGKAVGDFARVLVEAGISEDAFNASLAQTTSLTEREALVRNTLNNVLGGTGTAYKQANAQTIAYNQSQADLNIALASATAYTTPLLIAVTNLGTTFLTSLAPALKVVSTYLTAFIQLIAEAIGWIGNLFGSVEGGSQKTSGDIQGYQKAMASYTSSLSGYFGATEDGANGAIDSIQKLKKQTAGFDELNVIGNPAAASAATGGGGGGIGAVPAAPNPADFGLGGDMSSLMDMSGINKDLEEAKNKLKAILALAGLVGAGFAAWKITSLVKEAKDAEKATKSIGKVLKDIGGYAMIIAGALLLIDGYSKAWTEGVDWVNFAEMLAGVGLIVGGLALTIGGIAAPIALIVGTIALLVVGIKDLVENGYSMEAVILVAVAAIGVLIGVIWAFNAALLASPLTWIVVAIMAVVAVFVVLWNECESFRNFWISIWDAIVVAFEATVDWFEEAGENIASFFTGAWSSIKKAWSACGQFFKDVWQGIKNAFSSVGTFFSDTFSKAWKKVKDVFSVGGEIFSGIGEGILEAFKVVVNGIITGINTVVKLPFEGLNKVLDKIHDIEIAKVKPFKWLTWRATIPQIPKLATGGILTAESLFIGGEGGKKEAVLPLEQNTEWMDVLAERINGRNNPTKIVLALDGKELGYATINSINSITRQTGTLQLAIV